MMIYITSIDFNYDKGLDKGFSDVSLTFQTVGFPYTISGRMTITKEDYLANTEIDKLRQFVKNRVISDLS